MKYAQNYLQRGWWFFALNEKYCTSVEFKKKCSFYMFCLQPMVTVVPFGSFDYEYFSQKYGKADNFQKKITTDTLLCTTSFYWHSFTDN